jgi:ATP-dependent RNA helicase DeaD
MIFVNTRQEAPLIRDYLIRCGFKALMLNSDLTQESRVQVMRAFRTENPPIIVATDVCSRGLDIRDLDLIVNYDMPRELPTYVHRVGRTGRMKIGQSITLVDLSDLNDQLIIDDLVTVSII